MRVLSKIEQDRSEFSHIVTKYRRYVYDHAKTIAGITRISFGDAVQDVLTNMWSAYTTYEKSQVRLDGLIWDILNFLDGIYSLKHPSLGVEVQVTEDRCEPVQKTMSASSFVFMRMFQWRSNVLTAHYSTKNGYRVEKDKDGKRHCTRVVFEASLEQVVGYESDSDFDEDDRSFWVPINELNTETPEDSLLLKELVRESGIDQVAQQVLTLYASKGLVLPARPKGMNDLEFSAYLLGMTCDQVEDSLKSALKMIADHAKDSRIGARTCASV